MNLKKRVGYFVVTVALLSVVGCSAATSTATPTATVTVTQTVTASPAPVSPPAAPSSPGTPVQVKDTGATATFFQYKQISDEYNKDLGALEVEVCLGADPKDGKSVPSVSSQRWSLRDANNGMHDRPSGYTGNPVTPMYPEGGALNWGECARGWIIMPIVDGTPITEARYITSEGKVFSWTV
ncbi:hypothetical protein ACIQH9_21775 [Pseudarthrobacter oxydans]|nr:hypothetical protein [Pseudarthrobacter phenanthrenivorans]